MKLVKIRRSFSLLFTLLFLGYLPVLAQAQEEKKILLEKDKYMAPTLRQESARQIAYQRNGLVPDLLKDGEVIGGAFYVKLRAGFEGVAPASTAANIARQAGLRVTATSSLAGMQVPLALSLQEKRASISATKRTQILQAEAELSRIIEVSYDGNMHPRQAAALLQGLPEVEYAEPMSIPQALSPESPNDPLIGEQGQLAFVNAFEAWAVWPGDTNFVIGIIDAGINMYHEDLWPNIAINPGEDGVDGEGKDKATNGIDDDGNGVIDDWKGANLTFYLDGTDHGNTVGSEHGTQVAGYSSAATDNEIGIAGIGNQCRFFPVKTASMKGGGLVEAYNGVLYCARRGFKVINCSWGDGDYSRTEEDILKNVTLAYDVAVVAAAGNDFKSQLYYPAGYRYVLGVGGVNEQGQYVKTWGEHVDVSATSGTTTSGTSDYFKLDPATSYTTPVVSGIVALVRSRWPELDARQALAHVRLTSRNIDQLNFDKAKLIGYGKADAYQAVATDPFSHPGLIIDSVWVTDEEGNPKKFFALGEKGMLWFRAVNLLGDLTSGSAQVVHYAEDSASIQFDAAPLSIGALSSGQSWTTPQGVAFQVQAPGKGLTKVRIELKGDDYEDYAYELLRLYLPYSVYSTPRAKLTLTESGRIGFDYRDFGLIGEGVTFDTQSFIYEGGLIVAEDRDHVLDNVRGIASNDIVQNDDFSVVEVPSIANNYTLTISDKDANSDRRIGVEIDMQVQTIDTVENAMGILVRARNTRETIIDSLRTGLFLDWDLDGISGGQTVRFATEPVDKIAFYGVAANQIGAHAVAGIADPAGPPAFYAITYNTAPLSIADGFEKSEKWRTLSNGVGNPQSGPGDISMVIGTVFANLPPNGEDSALFVFGFSSDTDAEAIDGMRRFVAQRVSSVRILNRVQSAEITVRPNPAINQIEVQVPDALLGTNATLFLRTVDGRELLNLSSLLRGGVAGNAFRVDIADVPSGLYYLQLENGEQSVLRPVFVVK